LLRGTSVALSSCTALSSCAALSSSCRTGWLLRVTSHLSPCPVAPPSRPLVAPAGCWLFLRVAGLYRPIWLHRPLVLLSCRLVVVCLVASVALSCYAAFSSSRRACWLLPVGLSSCAALSSSRRTGWLLLVASPLSSYHLAPPSRPLVVPADCCMLSCRPIWFLIEFDCTIVNCKSMTYDPQRTFSKPWA
jgi:hypothetical protein